MNEAFPDHQALYRLTFPHEDSAPTPEPALVFDRMIDAWRHATDQVLKQPALAGESTVAVASALLDADDCYALHGWGVSRWAMTLKHDKSMHRQLSTAWSDGITLTYHDSMDDTWTKVSSLLFRDLLTYSDFHGVDTAVVTHSQVWIGLVVDCTPGGQITFADGQVLELDQAQQISVHLG